MPCLGDLFCACVLRDMGKIKDGDHHRPVKIQKLNL